MMDFVARSYPHMSPSPADSSRSSESVLPQDGLAAIASPELQKQAACTAQDAFARVFRLTINEDDAGRAVGVSRVRDVIADWARAGRDDHEQALRLAMVVLGLDQWGMAYSGAFRLHAIAGLSELVGGLRTQLDAAADARFQQQFAAIETAEGNAIDFKIELRRGIHLALWHAMIAAGERDEAAAILSHLGGLMLALTREMPQLGWRLAADALAHVQIQCLAQNLATEGLAQEMTESLFASLSRELPAETRDKVFAHAGRATLAWQQAQRAGSDRVH